MKETMVTEFIGNVWITYPEGNLEARLDALKQALEEKEN